ncbi:MAG: radical SAM protein [Coprothermobacterota bacterium]|nr:radical SAM protein [Coprothermobacterota bacterium]
MRSAGLLKRQAEEIIASTGWEELGLVSLSSSDYPHLVELLKSLGPLRAEQRVTVSLPSLRADSFSVEVAGLAQGHQITLTFAPEAGSDRLRQAIGKQLLEEEILTAVEQAARCRFPRIKLYFMIGLPTEREEDLLMILTLVEKLRRRAKAAGGGVKFSAAVSAFVPKPQTPFQWEPMERLEGIRAKRSFLRDRLRRMGAEAGGQQEELSILEGVLARGDRRVGEAVFFAWQEGARLDGWSDHFSYARWQSALARCGLEPSFYLHRTRPQEEILPWSLVRFPAGPAYLWRERERAYSVPLPTNEAKG